MGVHVHVYALANICIHLHSLGSKIMMINARAGKIGTCTQGALVDTKSQVQ